MPFLWATPFLNVSDNAFLAGRLAGGGGPAMLAAEWSMVAPGTQYDQETAPRPPCHGLTWHKETMSDHEQVACAKLTNIPGQACLRAEPRAAFPGCWLCSSLGPSGRPQGHWPQSGPASCPNQPLTTQTHTGAPLYQESCGGGSDGSSLGWPW